MRPTVRTRIKRLRTTKVSIREATGSPQCKYALSRERKATMIDRPRGEFRSRQASSVVNSAVPLSGPVRWGVKRVGVLPMKILIIGGTSFIGPAVVRRLVDLGHEVAVYHRGQTHAELPLGVEHIHGDRGELGSHIAGFRRFGPEVVVDMIAFTVHDASRLVETFRGVARRSVVISSADVFRAYGRFLGLEPGPIEPAPLSEESPLRTFLFPYRKQATGPDDFLFSYDKLPVERIVLSDPKLPGTILRLPMVHGPGDTYRRLSPT